MGVQVVGNSWHNMRSSRQTELAEVFPSHIVCAWIGNSKAVADEYFLQVTEDHYARALEVQTPKAAHKRRITVEMGRNLKESAHEETPAFQGYSHHRLLWKIVEWSLLDSNQ